MRTTMSEFVATFAVREHAEKWGKEMFGEHAFVCQRSINESSQMWDGKPYDKGKNS